MADDVYDGMEFLSLGAMLDAEDTTYSVVNMPEWGGKVRLGSLTAADMMEWLEANESAKKTAGLRLIVKSLVDKDGKRVGNDEAIHKFAKKNTKAIDRLIKEILKLNGLDTKTQADAKNDSSETPDGASPTTLH
jgi:hypothetical protein